MSTPKNRKLIRCGTCGRDHYAKASAGDPRRLYAVCPGYGAEVLLQWDDLHRDYKHTVTRLATA